MNQQLNLDSHINSNEEHMQSQANRSVVVFVIIPIAIILIGIVLAWQLMTSTPSMERVAKPRQARLVETVIANAVSEPIRLTAWGEVKAAQEVIIKAQVSGVVEKLLHPMEPGSQVKAGEPLLQLEKADYEVALTQKQAELDQAKANLEIEQGNQTVARSEYQLLGAKNVGQEKKLMLREPQLQVAKAQVKAAEAALAAARLDLQRATLHAPFAGVIKERSVNVGSHVAVNGDIAILTGTDTAWIEVSVPLNQLQWIQFPDGNGVGGSEVTIYYDQVWTAGQFRTGKVLRLLTDLEATGRMARILVQVDDPFAQRSADTTQPALLMGSFVRVELTGRPLENIVVIPAPLLHDQDTVWVYADDKLTIRKVDVLYRDQAQVYISNGISPGEQLVSSALSTATDGMAVRVKAGQGD